MIEHGGENYPERAYGLVYARSGGGVSGQRESLWQFLRGIRVRGLTLYLRDPGVGARYWHYRGHRPRLYGSFWRRFVGHSWHFWEGGIVIDGGEGSPKFTAPFFTCNRCEARR